MTATKSNSVPDFDFSDLEIAGVLKEFSLPWFSAFDDDACLVVESAGDTNAAYQEAMLAQSSNRQRAIAVSGPSLKTNKEDRDEDRELYALYIVKGWRGVRDKEGKPVEFKREACRVFLAALPSWIFDKLRAFCLNPERFLKHAPGNPAELAKN